MARDGGVKLIGPLRTDSYTISFADGPFAYETVRYASAHAER